MKKLAIIRICMAVAGLSTLIGAFYMLHQVNVHDDLIRNIKIEGER